MFCFIFITELTVINNQVIVRGYNIYTVGASMLQYDPIDVIRKHPRPNLVKDSDQLYTNNLFFKIAISNMIVMLL